MKNLVLLSLLVNLNIGFSQYCTYSGGVCGNNLWAATNYAENVVEEICEVLDIDYIDIYQGSLQNACATVLDGEPIIIYNPDFLNFLYQRNTWAPVSVIAHEVGHHLSKHSSWYGQFEHSWTRELKADYISGYALYKLGCRNLNDARSTFYIMFNWIGSSSHPDSPRRIAALTQGYLRAKNGY
ncbi:MAG: hypothetical protein AAGC43_14170 [Bacteroidota bacterium]